MSKVEREFRQQSWTFRRLCFLLALHSKSIYFWLIFTRSGLFEEWFLSGFNNPHWCCFVKRRFEEEIRGTLSKFKQARKKRSNNNFSNSFQDHFWKCTIRKLFNLEDTSNAYSDDFPFSLICIKIPSNCRVQFSGCVRRCWTTFLQGKIPF